MIAVAPKPVRHAVDPIPAVTFPSRSGPIVVPMRRRRRARRSQERPEPREAVPFDARQTASGIAGFEAGNGLAHGFLAIVIALGLAILIDPLRRALRAWFRQ